MRRLSRRARIAFGGRSRTRDAASSMASGRPSRRRQMATIVSALSSVSSKWLCTARARSTKRRTASEASASSSRSGPVGGWELQGWDQGAHTRRRCGAAPGWWPEPGCQDNGTGGRRRAATRRRRARSCRAPGASVSGADRRAASLLSSSVADSRMPRAPAMVAATSVADATGASGTNQTPSAYASTRSAATCSARRVLPAPPGPVSVSRRTPGCSQPAADLRRQRFATDERRQLRRQIMGLPVQTL